MPAARIPRSVPPARPIARTPKRDPPARPIQNIMHAPRSATCTPKGFQGFSKVTHGLGSRNLHVQRVPSVGRREAGTTRPQPARAKGSVYFCGMDCARAAAGWILRHSRRVSSSRTHPRHSHTHPRHSCTHPRHSREGRPLNNPLQSMRMETGARKMKGAIMGRASQNSYSA